ncbi:MAG: hypothetical protein MJ180_03350, partial [Candidatus Gastranaerophilales bacterium]|nr:hypothetical protein [Candidatus Gastranaerophilales bacterium]
MKADGSADFIRGLINAKKGYIFTDKGYSYTTNAKSCAKSCNSGADEENITQILLTILTPKGAKICNNKSAPQQEFIFPRNAQFRVVEEAKETVFTDKDGSTYTKPDRLEMTVEYILPDSVATTQTPTQAKSEAYPFEPTPIKEVSGKYGKPEYKFNKGYSEKTDTMLPTKHHTKTCSSEFSRYPEQVAIIQKLMQAKTDTPLSILNIGVAAGQEPLTYINLAYQVAKSSGKKISDIIDLTTSDLLASPPDFVNGTRETFPEDVIKFYEYICDSRSQKSNWNTPVEQLKVNEKKDVVLFNNVLQHMKDSSELKATLEYLADSVKDDGVFCFEISGHKLQDFEVQRLQMMHDILKAKGFVETSEGSGIFRKTSVKTQSKSSAVEKTKDLLARGFNFGNEVATEIAPYLSVSLEKLPAVPLAISQLISSKALAGIGIVPGILGQTAEEFIPPVEYMSELEKFPYLDTPVKQQRYVEIRSLKFPNGEKCIDNKYAVAQLADNISDEAYPRLLNLIQIESQLSGTSLIYNYDIDTYAENPVYYDRIMQLVAKIKNKDGKCAIVPSSIDTFIKDEDK